MKTCGQCKYFQTNHRQLGDKEQFCAAPIPEWCFVALQNSDKKYSECSQVQPTDTMAELCYTFTAK